MNLKIVSWNVNSVGARLERVKAFLERSSPDVLMLQELKCLEEKFPADLFTSLGYPHQAVVGQRTYNGVAILSRHPLHDIETNMGDGSEDAAARFVTAKVQGLQTICVYVPNGQSVESDKYQYKMQWLKRLRAYFDRKVLPGSRTLIGGDFNIAQDERDVYDPKAYEDSIHFTPLERSALQEVLAFGLVDTYRLHHDEGGKYSWWDYRQLAFPKNRGLRIDMIFSTPELAQRCVASGIERDERKGDKPSDHAPVWAEFSLG